MAKRGGMCIGNINIVSYTRCSGIEINKRSGMAAAWQHSEMAAAYVASNALRSSGALIMAKIIRQSGIERRSINDRIKRRIEQRQSSVYQRERRQASTRHIAARATLRLRARIRTSSRRMAHALIAAA